ncbi:MAG TPA: glycine/sarcosine/betaine reductase component B subunit, partial [Candidatus Binatia bacterium]|nr:glycine/sarcosine/betaine reductase component B subunit [Candidatus Binatia bacterium]
MELELFDFHVDDIQWGDQSALVGRQFIVSLTEIQEQIKDLTQNIKLTAQLARPGESKRIIHVLDTLMPIAKVDDERRTFPGIDHPARLVGIGRTERLRNVLVTIAGRFPHAERMTPIEQPREGLIDMSGIGARYCHGSDSFHIILTLEGEAALSNLAFDQALRYIGVRVARYLAGVRKSGAAPDTKRICLNRIDRKLP